MCKLCTGFLRFLKYFFWRKEGETKYQVWNISLFLYFQISILVRVICDSLQISLNCLIIFTSIACFLFRFFVRWGRLTVDWYLTGLIKDAHYLFFVSVLFVRWVGLQWPRLQGSYCEWPKRYYILYL